MIMDDPRQGSLNIKVDPDAGVSELEHANREWASASLLCCDRGPGSRDAVYEVDRVFRDPGDGELYMSCWGLGGYQQVAVKTVEHAVASSSTRYQLLRRPGQKHYNWHKARGPRNPGE